MKTKMSVGQRVGRNVWRQSAVGCLLLALLAANPFQALGQVGILNPFFNSDPFGVNLDLTFGPGYTGAILPGGTTIDTFNGFGGDAISASAQPWNLTVQGTANVYGNNNGVNFGNGGTVFNMINDYILGYGNDAVLITYGAGESAAVTNAGGTFGF